MPSVQAMLRHSGRKAKKWWESLFNFPAEVPSDALLKHASYEKRPLFQNNSLAP